MILMILRVYYNFQNILTFINNLIMTKEMKKDEEDEILNKFDRNNVQLRQ